MRNIYFTFFLIVLCFPDYGQTINSNKTTHWNAGDELGVSIGYGSYLMSDLKDVQKLILNANDMPLEITTSFPGYFNYSIRYGRRLKNHYEGFTAGFMSTGARSSLADYSGYILSDINCQAIYVGYYIQKDFYNTLFLNRHLEFGYNLNLSFIGSNVNMIDKLNLYDNSSENNDFIQTNKYSFNTIGIYSEPLLYARYMIEEKIGVEINAGGAFSLSSPLYYRQLQNSITINNRSRYVNWTGLRVSIGLVYRL